MTSQFDGRTDGGAVPKGYALRAAIASPDAEQPRCFEPITILDPCSCFPTFFPFPSRCKCCSIFPFSFVFISSILFFYSFFFAFIIIYFFSIFIFFILKLIYNQMFHCSPLQIKWFHYVHPFVRNIHFPLLILYNQMLGMFNILFVIHYYLFAMFNFFH